MVIMSEYPNCGYIGYIKESTDNNISSYFISDINLNELNVFILLPGSYNTLYNVLSKLAVSFKKINVFSVSMDIRYMTDIYRLILNINKIYNNIKFNFPIDPKIHDSIFNSLFIKGSEFVIGTLNRISIKYIPNKNVIDNFDIQINTENNAVYLSVYLSEEDLSTIYNINNEIHLPYSTTLNGGFSYLDIINNTNLLQFKDKLRINSFNSIDEKKYTSSLNLPIAESYMKV